MKVKNILISFIIMATSIISNAQINCLKPLIKGRLIYDNAVQRPLRYSIIRLVNGSGLVVDSCMTNKNGEYRFCNVAFGKYDLKVTTPYEWGGLSGTDALVALQHFAAVVSLPVLRHQAADVNKSGEVNGIDALLIIRRFVELDTSFPLADWIFEHAEVEVSSSVDYIKNIQCLCSGDLDGSFDPFIQTFASCGDTMTDQRDRREYLTVFIGNHCWMKKNLNMGKMVVSISGPSHSDLSDNDTVEKYCYNNDTNYCNVYGALYDWDELMNYDTIEGIQGICPEGWHVPTGAEVCELLTTVDTTVNSNSWGFNGTDAGGKLKEIGYNYWNPPNSGATNQTGFSVFGAGTRGTGGLFGVLKERSYYLTSTRTVPGKALAYGFAYNRTDVILGDVTKLVGYSLRCIKD